MDSIAKIESKHIKKRVPKFSAGDTVKVYVKIKEGDKERSQVFEGVVLQRRGEGTGKTFTVRKVSAGIGVERVFPLHSPNVSKIQVMKRGKVRRAKIFYLRKLMGKSAKIEEDKEKFIEEEEEEKEEEEEVKEGVKDEVKKETKEEKKEEVKKEAKAEVKKESKEEKKVKEEKKEEVKKEAKQKEPKGEVKKEAKEEKKEKEKKEPKG